MHTRGGIRPLTTHGLQITRNAGCGLRYTLWCRTGRRSQETPRNWYVHCKNSYRYSCIRDSRARHSNIGYICSIVYRTRFPFGGLIKGFHPLTDKPLSRRRRCQCVGHLDNVPDGWWRGFRVVWSNYDLSNIILSALCSHVWCSIREHISKKARGDSNGPTEDRFTRLQSLRKPMHAFLD